MKLVDKDSFAVNSFAVNEVSDNATRDVIKVVRSEVNKVVNKVVAKTSDSPGLKSLKSKPKAVSEKVTAFERKKVERNKVKLSPKKLKLKEVSNKIRSKMLKYDDDSKNKGDKKESKTVVIEIKDAIKLSLIKGALKENVQVKGKVEAEAVEVVANVEANEMVEVQNAFEVMLESSKGGKNTPELPVKRKKRRKIGYKTPDCKDIRSWFGKE